MNTFLSAAEPYQLWLILGGILLLIELLGTAGYALWCGVSAVIVALLTLLLPIGTQLQWLLFSAITLVVAIAWWRWSRSRTGKRNNAKLLNRPDLKLIGSQHTLIKAVVNGYGRVNVADSSWRVKSKTDMPEGTTVIVDAIEGNTLVVRKATHN